MIDQKILAYQVNEMGAQVREDQVLLRVWAPHAQAVYLLGTFNNWSEDDKIKLDPGEGGYWTVTTDQLSAGDEYKFLIKGANGNWLYKNDPYARQMTNSAGNSVVYQDQFDWEDDSFKMPPWNQLVMYEMHIGTFNAKEEGKPGNFDTAIEKLGYLSELGINAIEVMPINEFAGDYSWGYNPAYPYAVEEAYGGPDGFKRFVKAAHQHGIAVILDVVYNHFGPSDMDLWQFDGWSENGKGGIYFYNDWRSETPWGDTRPDYGREEVRQYIYNNAMMWLEEFRCDGLRMDMVPYIRNVHGDESQEHDIPEGFSLLKWINQSVAEKYPEKLMVAEDLHGNDFITNRVEDEGCGFGAQWDADFVHPVRELLIAAEDAHRDMQVLAKAIQRSYSGFAFHRIVYTDSHDEVANGKARLAEEVGLEVINEYFTLKKVGLGLVTTMVAPGIPMLFQGQELLEDKWFSDTDPIEWSRLDEFNGMNQLYRDVIRLRRNQDGYSGGLTGQNVQILHMNNDAKILALVRWDKEIESDGVLVILNFSNQSHEGYPIGIPLHNKWTLRLNSDWKGYSEKFDERPSGELLIQEESYEDQPFQTAIDLAPYGAYIYTIK